MFDGATSNQYLTAGKRIKKNKKEMVTFV